MNVVVEIEGREAIPVRAIPLLTNWNFFSPDVVANIFAEHKGNHGFYYGELQALRIENGHVNPLKREWWVSWAARELGALSEKIKRTGLPDEVGYQQWRDESLPLLPAGVFVWKDDFEQFHARNWNIRLRVFSSSISTGEDSGEVNPQMSRALVSFINDGLSGLEKWHELDFTPYIRPALSNVVMEGLPVLKSRARVAATFSEAAPANDAKTERQAKIGAMRKMMKSIRYLETEEEPGQEIEGSDGAASAHQRALNEIAERRHVALSGYPEPCSPMQTVASNAAPVETDGATDGKTEQLPDTERRLAALRALSGTANYRNGKWRFTGIAELVASEKNAKRKRSDEKTIRADLKEAAQAERDEKRAGHWQGLGA